MKKEEMVEALNEFFGFEIDWSKLTKDDLQKLYDFLNDPRNIIKRLIEVMGIEKFFQTVNNAILHYIVDERPVRKWIKQLLLEK